MKLRENALAKALAFLLTVALFTAFAMMAAYQIANVSVLWEGDDTFYGYTARLRLREQQNQILTLAELKQTENRTAAQESQAETLSYALSAQQTNLRWQLLGTDGTLYGGNTESAPPKTGNLTWNRISLSAVEPDRTSTYEAWSPYAAQFFLEGEAPAQVVCEDLAASLEADLEAWKAGSDTIDPDAVYVDLEGRTQILIVDTPEGKRLFGPTIRSLQEANSGGFRYDPERGWVYEQNGTEADLVMWLAEGLPVDDIYKAADRTLSAWKINRAAALAATVVCALAGLVLAVWLCAAAGHRKGREGISLFWFHRIPGDLLLCAYVAVGVLLTTALVYLVVVLSGDGWAALAMILAAVGLCTAGLSMLCVSLLVTIAARCKARTLLRSTVIGWLCAWCVDRVRAVLVALPLIWKAILISGAYLLFSILFVANNEFLWGIATVILLAYLCLWAYQWKKIRRGAREIIGGNVDYQIDTRRMLPDLKAHADELNNLGQSIAAAVDERMRSEHFKAELITNVSHDLKTPLTSIINYVDLLKKEEIDNPRAAEYIEVLDRKSQRLKKLTEDLVEASKASTGVLTVNLDRLDLVQLADQALAEYEDRLTQKGLAVVRTLPASPVWVEADGRHLWRVLDNLLSNCAKYALEGTRVYVAVQGYRDCAELSVKNISREELNIPPEQLVERFVRGDESRTQEGSGLGLSIAQSLTELQHGKFRVAIDGDLFKATVTLPLAPPAELL